MNKAKNGSKETKSQINKEKDNNTNNPKTILTTESSTQTDEDFDDINKNYKRAFIIKKKPKLETILLSKYLPIIFLMIISFYTKKV